jgi:uncharacterized protein
MTDSAAPPQSTKPISPCIQVCTLDEKVCIGCGRTIDDVIEWTRLSDAQKWVVIEQSKQRREQRQNCHQEGLNHGSKR